MEPNDPQPHPRRWTFAIDRGGTFTDIIGIAPSGAIHTLKILSESDDYDDAVIEGIRRVLGLKASEPLPLSQIESIRMGTTVATNALLEHKGEPVCLLITRGLRDAIEIGRQTRPDLFALSIVKPKRLYSRVEEITERIAADGEVIVPLDIQSTAETLTRLLNDGFRSIAIVFAHAWKNPDHENRVAEFARLMGFRQVSVSHRVINRINLVGRGQTTLVDAYLSPVLRSYVDRMNKQTGQIRTLFMQNTGGLTESDRISGKDAILSGPAGGVIGCAAVARANDIEEAIGLDMGGTSTDVCRYDGEVEQVSDARIAGIEFQTPMLHISTVAAGGGSILRFDGQKLRVGPDSAGAVPGPACYGLGGPATVTDANAVLGRILPEHFPATFGLTRNQPLQINSSFYKLEKLRKEICESLGKEMTVQQVALGYVRIANEVMCRPIRSMTLAKGRDVRSHGLICFGGAAGQHACGIAANLGIAKIVIPPHCSLLSAYGIAAADHVRTATQSILEILDHRIILRLMQEFETLERPLREELLSLGVPLSRISTRRSLALRPLGTDQALTVPFTDFSGQVRFFNEEYQRLFGFTPKTVPIEVVSIQVDVTGRTDLLDSIEPPVRKQEWEQAGPEKTLPVWFEQGKLAAALYQRNAIVPGQTVHGPALIVEPTTTVVVEPGFSAVCTRNGHLVLRTLSVGKRNVDAARDPVLLEVFNHLFMSVAEQMGVTLAMTAHSTNIRERRDFSCAVFDCQGRLVANAPHIPVHLGAMGDTVRALLDDRGPQLARGDVYVANNPFRGGSHLPDITVITPIFDSAGELIFLAANRGHHADIGGITPGSMPPDATHIEQEGVLLDNILVVTDGRFDEDGIREILTSGPFPARNITERLSDLRAQIAANQTGVRETGLLMEKYGQKTVQAYMGHIQDNAAEALEEALEEFIPQNVPFEARFADFLDEGSRIRVRIRIERDKKTGRPAALIDFTGTDPQLPGNLNAPLAVTRSAVLYVFRTLIRRDIPLNEGCFRPIRLVVPEGCLLNPRPGAAVVGGNVETSQRVVDVLLGALGRAAASQGTMNNLAFGKIDGTGTQYYETIAGGSGATEGHPGASAVQVHMTNTRITDVEILEHRFPEVRVERFEIRTGSGGKGKFSGGDGVTRAIRFFEPRNVTILSERRIDRPYGIHGGKEGAPGVNLLVNEQQEEMILPGKVSLIVQPGETVVIHTPGGGGWGEPEGAGKDKAE